MLSKKLLCFVIIFVFLLSIHGSVQAECQNIENLPAKSYILVEANTGKVLTEKNADEKVPPASITKIMTMLLLAPQLPPPMPAPSEPTELPSCIVLALT